MFEDRLKTIPDKPSETSAVAKRGEILTGKLITDKVNGKNGGAPGAASFEILSFDWPENIS